MKDKAIAKTVKIAAAIVAMPIIIATEMICAAIDICNSATSCIAYVISNEDDEKYANEIKEIFEEK